MNDNQIVFNNFNVFVEFIKDMVSDWINMHDHYQIDRSKINITFMNFLTEVEGTADAKYLDDKFSKYSFEVNMLQRNNIVLSVIDDTNDALVTKKWDGSSYLDFDKKGYSYELTAKEYHYLERAKNPAFKMLESGGLKND